MRCSSHTVITIHPLTSSPALDDIFSEFRSLLSQSILHSLPFSQSSSSMVGMRLSTAKTLSIELLDEIADWNWSLRDLMKQWKILISETLTDGYVSPGLLEHIHDLENISLCAGRLVTPQARMLQELVADEATGQGGVGEKAEADSASNTTQSGSALNHSWSDGSSGSGGGKKAGEGGGGLKRDKSVLESLSSSLRSLATVRRLRGQFLSDVSLDLRNLSKSVSRLSEQLKLTNDLSQPLLSYYKQRKDEETNKILYLLTVVTTIVTPLQLSSGIYGMNVSHTHRHHPTCALTAPLPVALPALSVLCCCAADSSSTCPRSTGSGLTPFSGRSTSLFSSSSRSSSGRRSGCKLTPLVDGVRYISTYIHRCHALSDIR